MATCELLAKMLLAGVLCLRPNYLAMRLKLVLCQFFLRVVLLIAVIEDCLVLAPGLSVRILVLPLVIGV